MTVAELVARWRSDAEVLRRRGAVQLAYALESCASELERLLTDDAGELLTLTEAAVASGYSPDSLGRLIRLGRLTNHGTRFRPKVLRAEIPKKAPPLRASGEAPHVVGASRRAVARAVVAEQRAHDGPSNG